MRPHLLLNAVLTLVLAAPAIVSARSLPYAQIDKWDVRIDTSVDTGCYIIADVDHGTILRIGADNSRGKPSGYGIIGNPEWASLKADERYSLHFQFDGKDDWEVPAIGVDVGDGSIVLNFEFKDPEILLLFSSKNRLDITSGTALITTISLRSSRKAVDALSRCLQAANAAHAATTDADVTDNEQTAAPITI